MIEDDLSNQFEHLGTELGRRTPMAQDRCSLESSYRQRSGQKESAHGKVFLPSGRSASLIATIKPRRFHSRQDLHIARRHPRPPEEDPKAVLAAAVARAEETTAIKVSVAASLSRLQIETRKGVNSRQVYKSIRRRALLEAFSRGMSRSGVS